MDNNVKENIQKENHIREMWEVKRGSHVCKAYRNMPFKTSSATNERMADALIGVTTIRKVLAGLIPSKYEDIKKEIVSQLVENELYESEVQIEQIATEMANEIVRYTCWENRKPFIGCKLDEDGNFITPPTAKVQLGDDIIKVKPSFVFVNVLKNEETGETINEVEFVKVKFGTQTNAYTQANASQGKFESLELYLMCLAAQQFVNPGTKCLVRASLYRMKRKDDTPSKPWTVEYDAPNGNNIISIGYPFTKEEDESKQTPTVMDRRYEKAVEEWVNGKEASDCTKEDCKYCSRNSICNYEEPPLATSEVAEAKKLSGVKWTASQEEAVNIEKGIYRINATAGAGKTATMVYHIAVEILKGVRPSEILMFSFTNAAVNEMKNRLRLVLEDMGADCDVDEINITTFNAFKDAIVQDEYERFGFTQPPIVVDTIENGRIIKDLIFNHPVKSLNYKRFKEKNHFNNGALFVCADVFAIMKKHNLGAGDRGIVKEELEDKYSQYFPNEADLDAVMELFDEYCSILEERNLITFADQDNLIEQLLHEEPDYLEQFCYSHIIVDEVQDTNPKNIHLLQSLCDSPTFEELTVVGDDSQAIYGFTGCSPKLLIDLEDTLDRGRVNDINLLENFRSSKEICEFANTIIDKNLYKIAKTMVSARGELKKNVVVEPFANKQKEYEFIVETAKKKIEEGYDPTDICIIARNKDELREIADKLTEAKIPSAVLFPEFLLENSRVRAAIALAKAYKNDSDTDDILTYANALAGGGFIDAPEKFLNDAIKSVKKDFEAMSSLTNEEKKVYFMEMLKNIDHNEDELYLNFLENLEKRVSLDDVISYLFDFEIYGTEETATRSNSYPGVQLETAHSSKGLEWKVVINSISHYDSARIKKAGLNSDLDEEARRLLFVSATRARDELIITSTYYYGKTKNVNHYLIESLRAVGKDFSPADMEAALKEAREETNKKTAETKKKWSDWLRADILANPQDYSEKEIKKAKKEKEAEENIASQPKSA